VRFQVAIVGAGMVGSTLACALASRGFRVALVEAGLPVPESQWPAFDMRVSAITRASERIFRSLDVWEGMSARRVSPYREMHVWDAGGLGAIHFDSADIGEPTLGHIVENRVTVAALEARLAGLEGVTWRRPARIVGMARGDGETRLELDDGGLTAELVVGADGVRSRVRELAGIAVAGADYGQQALVATVRTEKPHRETAWQRFLPGGPLAFLPLLDGYSSIVWSAPPGQVQTLLSQDDEAFCLSLTEAFEARLGAVEWVGPRAAFPLRHQHAENYVQPGLALVGDAAHAIHPLAGQGVNLGLLDAASLAEVLAAARDQGRGAGERRVLRRYERWRKGHNLATEAIMGGFKRLFGSQAPLVPTVRGLGLKLTDAAVPAKRIIMRRAMGLQGDLPAMARGGVSP